MKTKDQLLLEDAYLNIFTKHHLAPNSQDYLSLVEADQRAIDELVEEAFGDWLKQKAGQVGQAIKTGAQAAKQAVSSGIIQTLANTFTKKYSNVLGDILVKLIQASDGKVDPQINKAAKEIIGAPAGAGQPATNVKESLHYENKAFLASLIFTETNTLHILESLNQSGLLTEAKSKRQLEQYAKEVAAKINQIYPKNKQDLAAALPAFFNKVSTKLGVPSTPAQAPTAGSAPAAAPVAGSAPAAAPVAGSAPAAAPVAGSAPAAAPAAGSAPAAAAPTAGTASTTPAAPPQPASALPPQAGGGLISKVMSFIKAHPVISGVAGATALALVVSAFAGSAPVIIPALLAGVKGALTGAGGNLLIQVLKNKFAGNAAFKDIDWAQVGKTGLTVGALGALGKVLSMGLGYIVKAFDPVIIKHTQTWGINSLYGGKTTETPAVRGLASWTGNVNDAHVTGATKVTDSYGYQPGTRGFTGGAPIAPEP